MKKLSVIALFLVFIMLITGCSGNELKLYDAFMKSQDITSMESDTVINLSIEGENFPEEVQERLQSITSVLSPMEMYIHQKMMQDKEKTTSRALADVKVNYGGVAMDMSVWVDLDMSGDEFKLVEIIKMPPLIMYPISKGDTSKEYIVYDFEELIGNNKEENSLKEFMKFAKEMQPRLTKLARDSVKNLNLGFDVIKYKGKNTVDGKELDVFELKLDDAAFKELLKYTVNYYIEDKDLMEFCKEYINLMMSIAKPVNEEEQLTQVEIKKELEEIEKELPTFKEKFNTFMDIFKDVKVIGDKGIVIEYGVNNEGYIVNEKGSIDLRFDINDLDKLSKTETPEGEGLLKLGIDYSTKKYSINSEIKIDLPSVDEKNSLNFMDMMNSNMMKQEPVENIDVPIEVTEPAVVPTP